MVTDTQRKRNNIIYINLEENIGIGCLKEKDEQGKENRKDKEFVTPVKYCTKEVCADDQYFSPYGKSRFRVYSQ